MFCKSNLFTLVLLSCLNFCMLLETNAVSNGKSKILSRSRRYVAFPEGASLSCAGCMTVGVIGQPAPHTNPGLFSWGVNWAIAYELPNSTETAAYYHIYKRKIYNQQHMLKRKYRRDLYQKLETILDKSKYYIMESRGAKLVKLAQKSCSVKENDSLNPPASTSGQQQIQQFTESPNISDSDNGGDFSGSDSDEYKPVSNKTDSSSSSDDSSSTTSSSSEDEQENYIATHEASIATHEASIVTHDLPREPQDLEHSAPKQSKKRTRNPMQWKRNVAKQSKNTGQEYISRTGKYVKGKTMGPVCSFKCRLSCRNKFTEEERQVIFDSYWELGDFQRQRDFLSACIKPLKVAYRRVKVDNSNAVPVKPRTPNTAYYFIINGLEKRVCKTFLLNTLNIAERTLRTVIHGKHQDLGTAPQDKRGCHSNHSNLPEEIKQSIVNHIKSIPKVESHYLRANTSREYIDGGLTVSEMHRNYENLRREYNLPTAPYTTYLYIFNNQFNIVFFCPKKDQCDICVGYKNTPDEIKPTLEADYKLHLEEKSLSRLEKQSDMNNDNIIVATYDLQAVLPCPVGDSSAFFYKTRLNCYNFTITNGRNELTTCYFWHEGLGHRGAIEIGSCVYKYLEELALKHPNCNIVFYSDNCCGQQKNNMGYTGRECILKTICETGQRLTPRGDNMIEEMFRTLFTMPPTKVLPIEPLEHSMYDAAHRLGRILDECDRYKCAISLIDLMKGYYNAPSPNEDEGRSPWTLFSSTFG